MTSSDENGSSFDSEPLFTSTDSEGNTVMVDSNGSIVENVNPSENSVWSFPLDSGRPDYGSGGTVTNPGSSQSSNGQGNSSSSKTSSSSSKTSSSNGGSSSSAQLSETARLCNEIIQTEGARLAQYVLPNGAIPMYNISKGGTSKLSPYFSCSAALGLLEAGYSDKVESYIKWHISKLQTKDVSGLNGTIYDYDITVNSSGQVTKEEAHNDYDSVDSYSALFLTLLKEYVVKTGKKDFVKQYRSQIDRIYGTLNHTLVLNGDLTFAKPTYKVKYLMDNCEVVMGCRDAAYLYRNVFSDTAAAKKCDDLADLITSGINKLWYSTNSNYDYAKGSHSKWNIFYADAAAQLFPVAFGVVSPGNQREKDIYSKFKQEYPSWATVTTEDFPWVILTRASLAHKDYSTTTTFLKNIKSKFIDKTGGLWYCQESGLTIWTAAKLKASVG